MMRQLTVGLTAHVDAGKTTLAEAMLFHTGEIRKRGRVDHGDSVLDTNEIERSRGITVFAHQASLTAGDTVFTLLDTPGHVDFSAETERMMQVLDYAVLVISGTDGVQSHTRTLWRLLEQYHVPVLLFVNKMDIADRTEPALMQELQGRLSPNCIQFDTDYAAVCEQAAACSETMMQTYFETDTLPQAMLREAVAAREVFPVCFGAARELSGVDSLLQILVQYTKEPPRTEAFGAQVFKISADAKGSRLTFLKIRGGTLRSRDTLTYQGADHTEYSEKITGIRFYAGAKYVSADAAEAGAVCAVTGLSAAYAGMGLGCCGNTGEARLTPVMRYRVQIPAEIPVQTAVQHFKLLADEDPQLRTEWDARSQSLFVHLMGAVQLEVLTAQVRARFGYDVTFDSGAVTYRETIAAAAEGVGHYEPLRHYAEVHLLLEPLPQGSGLQFGTRCSEDALDRNWQRLILTHLQEKTHLGVLTGSPITDMKITLMSGRSHIKHTEGGDFRQATYRAVRQGLRSAESVLLEPYYDFTLSVPADCVGRAMTDMQQRAGEFAPPEIAADTDTAVLSGSAPAAKLNDYASEVLSYTKGRGALTLSFGGYRPCKDAEAVIAASGYDPDSDTENSADSVFCVHGAGFLVNWAEVPQYMHLPSVFDAPPENDEEMMPEPVRQISALPSASDEELMAVYERTYGKINRENRKAMRRNKTAELQENVRVPAPPKTEYLLVDGYNIIFAWDELKALAKDDLSHARDRLLLMLQNYQGYRQCEVILVFDAYKLKGHGREIEQHGGVSVVYTKEAETADSYIERVSKQLIHGNRVRVATSDGQEQLIIMGNGALRLSAREFYAEMQAVTGRA